VILALNRKVNPYLADKLGVRKNEDRVCPPVQGEVIEYSTGAID
jgi:hypothetical protein